MNVNQFALSDICELLSELIEKLTILKKTLDGEEQKQEYQQDTKTIEEFVFREFQIWKIVRNGVYKDVPTIQKAFLQVGCKINSVALDLLNTPAFKLSTEEQDVYLAKVSGRDLGFTKAATRANIYKRATTAFKLDLCQPEDGVSLREKYLNQPTRELLLIAIKPMTAKGGVKFILGVEQNGRGSLILDASFGGNDFLWDCDFVWVFRCRKPT